MIFNHKLDRVVGKVIYYDDNQHGEILVKGIYINNSEFRSERIININEEFPPNGKVFIPDITDFPDKDIQNGDYIEFSTQSIQKRFSLLLHDYTIDLYKDFAKILPNIVLSDYLTKVGYDYKYEIINTNISDKTEGYLYDNKKHILYEKITNLTEKRVKPSTGITVKGIKYNIERDDNLLDFDGQIGYMTKSFCPNFSRDEIVDELDLSNEDQKIRWFKEEIKNLNKFDSENLPKINKILNIIKDKDILLNSSIIKSRIQYIEENINETIFSDAEIKNILRKNSNIGNHLLDQIVKNKDTYCKNIFADIEKEKNEIDAKLNNLNKGKTKLDLEIKSLKKSSASLSRQKDSLERDVRGLKDNKDLIYLSLKAQLETEVERNTFDSKDTKQNNNSHSDYIEYDIYKVESDSKVIEKDDIEDCLDHHSKIQKTLAIIKNKYSFIPSISWTYSLAHFLGNSEVLNLSVEYDWLHYKDFVKNGLIEFIRKATESPDKFFFLHFDNLNIIPLDCGFSPIFKVFSQEKPFFNGTTLSVPNNVFVTATLLPSKTEKSVGNSIPENFKLIFKGIGDPNKLTPIKIDAYKSQYKYCFNNDFEEVINDLSYTSSEGYYDF
jgi:hypothetical protein